MKKKFSDETFLARWLAGKLKEQEQRDFEQREDYEDYSQIIAGIEQLELPAYDEEQSWRKLLEKQATTPPTPAPRVLGRRGYAIAASIVLLIGVGLALLFSKRTYTTANAQQLTIELLDASTVQLNNNTTLRYNRLLWYFGRNVSLNGEAFFDVEPGNTFTVGTPTGKVTVLGTSFNVWARQQQLEVVCHSGKVQVESGQQTIALEAGEKAIASPENIERQKITALPQAPSWTTGISKFDRVSVGRILKEMEQHFDVTIVYSGDLEKELTFSFPHNDLDAALRLLSGALEANFEVKPDKTVILEDNE